MADAKSSGTLAGWYNRRIGEPTTDDEVTGYWLFVGGVIVGILGIVLFFLADSRTTLQGISYALTALAPPFLLLGSIIRFPLRRMATYLGYLGLFLSVIAVIWFVSIFPGGWVTATGDPAVISLYGVGVLLIGIAGAFVPMLTEPIREQRAREQETAAREEDLAASQEEVAAGREELAAREEELSTREEDLAASREELATARERSEELQEQVAALQGEIDAYQQSQARFELFEDKRGQHRWRLRHRNGNVIADSGESYTRLHNAQKGMHSVKRNALGAGVIQLKAEADEEEPEPEDAEEPVIALPTDDEEIDVSATFEVYEDSAGEHRWRLRHDNGNILADSGEGYGSASAVRERVDRVREYVGPGDYLWFDPAGFEVYRDRGGEFRWRLVHRNGNILADSGEGYTRRHDASRAVDRIRERIDDLEFEVYEDSAGEHRWRLLGGNDQILGDSGEGYSDRDGVEEAVERVQRLAPEADVLDIGRAAFEIFEDKSGQHRWRLRHRNGNILADSGEGYSDRSGARDAIESIKRNAPNAAVEEA